MTRRRIAVSVLAALVAISAGVGAVLVSRRTSAADVARAAGAAPAARGVAPPVIVAGGAPSLSGGAGWLNTAGLRDADLVGRVVLYDFWTFGCINCAHTLPHLLAWQQRYAGDGLVIVGIHSPEFSYEADPGNVARYVAEHGITYPVLLDPQHHVWQTWDVPAWPAFYLHDRAGRRLVHLGEGAYEEMEDAIRVLLGVDPASPRATVTGS